MVKAALMSYWPSAGTVISRSRRSPGLAPFQKSCWSPLQRDCLKLVMFWGAALPEVVARILRVSPSSALGTAPVALSIGEAGPRFRDCCGVVMRLGWASSQVALSTDFLEWVRR